MRGQFTYFMNDLSSDQKRDEIGKLSPHLVPAFTR